MTEVSSSSSNVIAIDIGGTNTRGAIVDAEGAMQLRYDLPTDPTAGTKGILSVIENLLGRGFAPAPIAVGIGAAGFIDADRRAVTFSPNLVYDDPKVADAVEARFGLPTVVENDANVAAWAERAYGAARGSNYVAGVTIGTGIGAGFIEGGRMVRGFSGAGAELGHMVIDPDGPQCPCGLRGCFEQMASGGAIARNGREAAQENPDTSILAFAGSVDAITGEHVAKAAREYDETARDVMRRTGRYLGIGLSNVVNIFDPEVIVLGGGAAMAGEAFLGAARDQLVAMTTAQRRRPMRLDVTTLKGQAGLLGAAALAFDATG